jgi:hypothetical protein
MLIATMDHEVKGQAKIVGYFTFPDRDEFTNLVIKCGETCHRFPIQKISMGGKHHRVALFGDLSIPEIQLLVPAFIPIMVNADTYSPSNGGASPVFLFQK